MRRHRRAKIVATVGPASASSEMLKELFLAGVDTFRLNFSHGTQDGHAKVHAAIRSLEKEVQRPIGILMDLQGPKIRVGTLRDGKIEVKADQTIRFVLSGTEGDASSIPLPHNPGTAAGTSRRSTPVAARRTRRWRRPRRRRTGSSAWFSAADAIRRRPQA